MATDDGKFNLHPAWNRLQAVVVGDAIISDKHNTNSIHKNPMKYIALALSAVILGLASCKSSTPTAPPTQGGYTTPAK